MRHLLLVLCFCCSGLLQSVLASNRLRIFHYNDTVMKRTTANEHCKTNDMNLVTLYDKHDAKFVSNFIQIHKSNIWVGLRLNSSQNSTDQQKCDVIVNTTLDTKNCSENLYFMCSGDFKLVREQKNWCLAKQYCRDHGLGDLVSSDNITEQIIKVGQTFWIGQTMHDEWIWEDNSCSTFRDWVTSNGGENANATVITPLSSEQMMKYDSENEVPVLCSKGAVRIVVINSQNLTWEQALDYCDTHHSGFLQILTQEDQNAVVEWLNRTGNNGTFWIGLRQSRVMGFWIWKDRMVDSSHWENDRHPEMPMSQHCGVIKTPSYRWSDEDCLHPLPFICEEVIVQLNLN